MCLQEDLRAHGLDPAMVDRGSDQTMAENEAALRTGSFDAIQVFQPYAEQLIRDGIGHIWYGAATRGPCAYTTLYTTRRMLKDDPQTLLAMTRAIYRTQKWLHATPDSDVARTIASYFPELEVEILTACIARYRSLGIWNTNPVLPRGGFDLLRRSCLSGGLITTGADYETCVDTSLARQAIAADPPSM
jgi:NitT/TauT family transport system substrate-binding protein